MVIARTLTPNPLPQAGEEATRVVPRTDVCYPLSLWERVRVRGSEATCHR